MVKIVIHFGMNPVSGGNPPNDISNRGIRICIYLYFRIMFLIVDLEEIENFSKSKNMGAISSEYIEKYNKVIMGYFIADRLIIHPMWVIDEYAIIVRRCD